jgi:hypothetical protein
LKFLQLSATSGQFYRHQLFTAFLRLFLKDQLLHFEPKAPINFPSFLAKKAFAKIITLTPGLPVQRPRGHRLPVQRPRKDDVLFSLAFTTTTTSAAKLDRVDLQRHVRLKWG